LIIIYQNNVLPTPQQGGELDAMSPTGKILYLFGSAETQSVFAGHYWRLITANFLHGGIIHILFNSFSLFQIGQVAEAEFGGAKYLCLYIITGVAVSLRLLRFLPIRRLRFVRYIRNHRSIGRIWIIAWRYVWTQSKRNDGSMDCDGAIMSLMPGISFLGHLGGLLAGGVLGFFSLKLRGRATVCEWSEFGKWAPRCASY